MGNYVSSCLEYLGLRESAANSDSGKDRNILPPRPASQVASDCKGGHNYGGTCACGISAETGGDAAKCGIDAEESGEEGAGGSAEESGGESGGESGEDAKNDTPPTLAPTPAFVPVTSLSPALRKLMDEPDTERHVVDTEQDGIVDVHEWMKAEMRDTIRNPGKIKTEDADKKEHLAKLRRHIIS